MFNKKIIIINFLKRIHTHKDQREAAGNPIQYIRLLSNEEII